MAWPVDQSGLNQDSIYYGYHSADPSPFVPLPSFLILVGDHLRMECILGDAIPRTVSPAVPCQLAPPVPGSRLPARTPQTQIRPPPSPPPSTRNQSLSLKRRKIPNKPLIIFRALPCNASGKVAATRAISTVSMNLSVTFGKFTSLP